MSGYRIGQLARSTGVKVETIRFYEGQGLLPKPARTSANYRLFEPEHLDRLSFIKRSRDLGFTLNQVRDLLRLADNPAAPCADVDAMIGHHVTAIETKIRDLRALQAELMRWVSGCAGETVSNCRIIEALSPAGTSEEAWPPADSLSLGDIPRT